MTDPESVIGFDALYESMLKCKRGVIWKDSVARYNLNAVEETIKLEDKLRNGTYRAMKPITFKVTHPKERDIVSIAFRDRVYQRSLNDVVLYPVMTRSFISANTACQKGKGTDAARELIKKMMRSEFCAHGRDFYILQCDIKGYYPNMRHDAVLRKFARHLDPWSYQAAAEVLTGQYGGDIGFNPGSQMVQIAGISLLDDLDHYIKERLHIKRYMRYMDDFILIHHDRGYLEMCREKIDSKLSEIGMRLHPQKTRIFPAAAGLETLGFIFRISETGKVTMTIRPQNVKAERKKLRRLANLARVGKITKTKADECYRSWRDHAAKGDSRQLLINMDRYYKNLWKEA